MKGTRPSKEEYPISENEGKSKRAKHFSNPLGKETTFAQGCNERRCHRFEFPQESLNLIVHAAKRENRGVPHFENDQKEQKKGTGLYPMRAEIHFALRKQFLKNVPLSRWAGNKRKRTLEKSKLWIEGFDLGEGRRVGGKTPTRNLKERWRASPRKSPA